jgi:hypothetical protein
LDDKVVHRIAMLLNGYAGDIPWQTGGALVAEEMREIVRYDRVFVCKARTAGQFSGSWFLFKCVGQGGPAGNRFFEKGVYARGQYSHCVSFY